MRDLCSNKGHSHRPVNTMIAFMGASLAEAPVSSNRIVAAFRQFLQTADESVGRYLPRVLGAIAILFLGWLLATAITFFIRKFLRRWSLNQRLGQFLTNQSEPVVLPPVEQWIALGIFSIVMGLVAIALLETLNLEPVSRPLSLFLRQIVGFLPRLGGAVVLLGLAWAIATISRSVLTQSLRNFKVDERVNQSLSNPDEDKGTQSGNRSVNRPTKPSVQLSTAIGNTLYWFVFLIFLLPILTTLNLEQSLQPVQTLLSDILLVIPKIVAALLVGGIGWLLARFIRIITTQFLAAAGIDRLGEQLGLSATKGFSLSKSIGTLAYALILVPVGITALNKLEIAAISAPAISMLTQVSTTLPQLFAAVLIFFVACVLGRWLSRSTTNFLRELGFDQIFIWLGIRRQPAEKVADGPSEDARSPIARTPSEVVGTIVLIVSVLLAAITAFDVLGLSTVAQILSQILAIVGNVAVGIFVFAIGLYLANLTFELVSRTGRSSSRLLAQVLRIAIIGFVSAMALQQMGIAPSIVNLAFGLMLGSVTVASALAFGLGGHNIARKSIHSWLSSLNGSDK